MNKLNLPVEQWVSIGKGALVAGAGAILTYLAQNVTAADFGTYGPLVVAGLSVLVNYIRKVVVNPDTPPGPNAPMA